MVISHSLGTQMPDLPSAGAGTTSESGKQAPLLPPAACPSPQGRPEARTAGSSPDMTILLHLTHLAHTPGPLAGRGEGGGGGGGLVSCAES